MMDKERIFKGRTPGGCGCRAEALQEEAKKDKREAQRRRRALDEKWIEILNASTDFCSQSREAERAAEMLQPFWEKEPAGLRQCKNLTEVLRGLIDNRDAAGFCSIHLYNIVVLAANELLGTNAMITIDPYIVDALFAIESGGDKQLGPPVDEYMLKIIAALAYRCKKAKGMLSGYTTSGTPNLKELCRVAQCLQIQCRCNDRNLQSREMQK